MTKLTKLSWVLVALITLPSIALAQTPAQKPIAVAGYTDAKGQPLPGGDTRIEVKSDGTTTTMVLQNLYAYGEAGMKPDENGKREAWYGSNPGYFQGGTVYALRLGNDWRGGRTAAQVDLTADKGVAVLGQGKVGDNQVTITFPSKKAAASVRLEFQPMNFLLVKADGKKAWLGHAGWAVTNTSTGIGDFLVLAANDKRFPATVVGYDQKGMIVKLTPETRAELAKVILPPGGAQEATAKANEQ